MDSILIFKALADETRQRILRLLLSRNYCVRALARCLDLTEAAISQHLKTMREAGLLIGEKKGYFTHHRVDRSVLHSLAAELDALAQTAPAAGSPEHGGCRDAEKRHHVNGESAWPHRARCGKEKGGAPCADCRHHKNCGEER
jgi:ArsR family transcriptional regulator